MDSFLTRQLDEQLSQAASRSNDPGRPPLGGFNGRPDPLDARGQSVGTLNARILNGQVNSGGFLGLGHHPLRTLVRGQGDPAGPARTARPRWTGPCPMATTGLIAVETSYGDALVTGLPLAGEGKHPHVAGMDVRVRFPRRPGADRPGGDGADPANHETAGAALRGGYAGVPAPAGRRRGGTRSPGPAVELQSGNRGGQRGACTEPDAGQRGQRAGGTAAERDQSAAVRGRRIARTAHPADRHPRLHRADAHDRGLYPGRPEVPGHGYKASPNA